MSKIKQVDLNMTLIRNFGHYSTSCQDALREDSRKLISKSAVETIIMHTTHGYPSKAQIACVVCSENNYEGIRVTRKLLNRWEKNRKIGRMLILDDTTCREILTSISEFRFLISHLWKKVMLSWTKFVGSRQWEFVISFSSRKMECAVDL